MAKRKRKGSSQAPAQSVQRRAAEKRESPPPQEVTSEVTTVEWSGPLPMPEQLGAYENVHKGSADRIIAFYEYEQRTNRRRVDGSIFVAALIAACVGIAAWKGHVWIAVPLGFSASITALIKRLTERTATYSERE
jgi:hypothetical protein